MRRNAFSNQIVTSPPFSFCDYEPVQRCPFSGTHFCICRSSRFSARLQEKVFRSAYTVWQQGPARLHSVPERWAERFPGNTGTWYFRSKLFQASHTHNPEEGSRTPDHSWHISESPVSGFLSFLSQSVPVRFFPLAFLLVKYIFRATLYVLSGYPLTNRRCKGCAAEPFSKNFLKNFSAFLLQRDAVRIGELYWTENLR